MSECFIVYTMLSDEYFGIKELIGAVAIERPELIIEMITDYFLKLLKEECDFTVKSSDHLKEFLSEKLEEKNTFNDERSKDDFNIRQKIIKCFLNTLNDLTTEKLNAIKLDRETDDDICVLMYKTGNIENLYIEKIEYRI